MVKDARECVECENLLSRLLEDIQMKYIEEGNCSGDRSASVATSLILNRGKRGCGPIGKTWGFSSFELWESRQIPQYVSGIGYTSFRWCIHLIDTYETPPTCRSGTVRRLVNNRKWLFNWS